MEKEAEGCITVKSMKPLCKQVEAETVRSKMKTVGGRRSFQRE